MTCSPDNMMEEVRRCPSTKTLEDLKDCLDFCSTFWTAVFCRLGGIPLLLQVHASLCAASCVSVVSVLQSYCCYSLGPCSLPGCPGARSDCCRSAHNQRVNACTQQGNTQSSWSLADRHLRPMFEGAFC